MSKYKPFLSPLGYFVCGNPYCEEGINKYTYEVGKCPVCNCEYDKTKLDKVFNGTSLDVLKPIYREAIVKALEQAQKQEKLLELYEKLADYRLLVIHKLLDEIVDLVDIDIIKEDIDYIMVEAKKYGDEDFNIVKEIAKIKELEK